MITMEALKNFGANTEEGLARCMNREDFYIKMVTMGIKAEQFTALEEALKANEFEKAFEAAHALKGILGNLSLTPILEPVQEITEHLRAKDTIDYAPLYEKVKMGREALVALL